MFRDNVVVCVRAQMTLCKYSTVETYKRARFSAKYNKTFKRTKNKFAKTVRMQYFSKYIRWRWTIFVETMLSKKSKK